MMSSSLLDLDWPEEAVLNRLGSQDTAQISVMAKAVSSFHCFIASSNLYLRHTTSQFPLFFLQ